MRKASALLLAAAVLAGCGPREITAGEDEIIIRITPDVSGPVYRAYMIYGTDGDFLGGQSVCHADGSSLSGPLSFTLTEMEFPEGCTRENFSFQIMLSDDPEAAGSDLEDDVSGTYMSVYSNLSDAFTPQYGTVYKYTVTGDLKDGIVLSPEQ